jgi:uncharacterized protein YegJ (DUF2314 family)
MRLRFIPVIIVLALSGGCGGNEDRVTSVSDDDPRMNAAIAKARETVDTFIAALQSPRTGQSEFTVKMAFTDGEHTEHMWLSPVSYDGKIFHGTVQNDPANVANVKLGQAASIEPSKISDWMYVENGKLVGGYTVRALREIMPPSERAEFDRTAPFRIE